MCKLRLATITLASIVTQDFLNEIWDFSNIQDRVTEIWLGCWLLYNELR